MQEMLTSTRLFCKCSGTSIEVYALKVTLQRGTCETLLRIAPAQSVTPDLLPAFTAGASWSNRGLVLGKEGLPTLTPRLGLCPISNSDSNYSRVLIPVSDNHVYKIIWADYLSSPFFWMWWSDNSWRGESSERRH